MTSRRKVSSDLSAALVEYLLKTASLTQETLAEVLEVSPAFISRVRTKERSFTIDHLAEIEAMMKVPLGAILLAAMPFPNPRRGTAKLHSLARQAIAQADALSKKSVGRAHSPSA